MDVQTSIPYADIPHFPLSTVESHTGRLLLGTLQGRNVVTMQGRFHRYEGYSLQQIVHPLRTMFLLGARTLIVSNVSGGMNPLWRAGDLVILTDHINLLGDNPLVGPNLDDLGVRFPVISERFDRECQNGAEQVYLKFRIPIRRSLYLAVEGPNVESLSKYRKCRQRGSDLCGMSMVREVTASRHVGLWLLGFRIISDI